MSYGDFRSRFFELPLEIGRNFYTTTVGGFSELYCIDIATGRIYAGVGINESKLGEKEILPNSRCLVSPVECLSRKIMPALFKYPAVIIPLSRNNYPYELSMSPNGEAVLPVLFGKSGPETLDFEVEKGDQIILNFAAFDGGNLLQQFIDRV